MTDYEECGGFIKRYVAHIAVLCLITFILPGCIKDYPTVSRNTMRECMLYAESLGSLHFRVRDGSRCIVERSGYIISIKEIL